MSATDFARVGVVGFGAMGGGIAQVVAASGRSVVVLEVDEERLAAGRATLGRFLEGGRDRGKLSEAEVAAIDSRIAGTTAVDDFADVALVIEAATEDRALKREILRAVDAAIAPSTIVATNTSALSVSDLATAVTDRGRFAGLHFFNPAPLMPIVEVVHGLDTDESTVQALVGFSEAIGKSPVIVADGPGFLVNRLLMPYLNDAIAVLDEQLGSAEDIDLAVKLGLGHKQGPFELLDLVGLDVHRHATGSAYDATLDPVFAPPPLLSRMVAAGRLGRKSGTGFHSYGESR